MKKSIVIIIVTASLVGGYFKLRSMELEFAWEKGETVKIGRGDLTIPINATGPISPLSRHQIKSQASGEVIEILKFPGDPVKEGELLMRLKKDNERRSYDRAEADVTRTRAALESAKIKGRRLKSVGLQQAKLRIDQTQAQLDLAEFNFNKIKRLFDDDQSSNDEYVRFESQLKELVARLRLAEADLADAEIAIELAHQDVVLARAANDQAETALRDAEERLAETDIISPVDGVIVDVLTQIGEVIQGGRTTLTGGTVLAIVANMDKIYVRAEVDEADIGAVCNLVDDWAKPGFERPDVQVPIEAATPVKVRVESFHEEEFTGTIERIYPEPSSLNSTIVTYQVDIVLTSDNRDKLLAGMQADVEFTAQSAYDSVLVPHEAIHRNEISDELGVYIPVDTPGSDEQDKKFIPCKFGLDNGMYAQVLSGVQEGDTVYTKVPRRSTGDGDS